MATDWTVVDTGSFVPSSVWDADETIRDFIYFNLSPANGTDIYKYELSTQTATQIAFEKISFIEDPTDDTYTPYYGSRNTLAWFLGDLYAMVGNDKLNAGGGYYTQVWRYTGTGTTWEKVFDSGERTNDEPWLMYTDGVYLIAGWANKLIITEDGDTWDGPLVFLNRWSQSDQAANLPMGSLVRMGMMNIPRIYGNRPIQFWSADSDAPGAGAKYDFYKFNSATPDIELLIPNWGNYGETHPNIHCADHVHIWKEDEDHYAWTEDLELDPDTTWTEPTDFTIRPIPTVGLENYSIGVDIVTREVYLLNQLTKEWELDGELDTNSGTTSYEPVCVIKADDDETYMVVVGNNTKILYQRNTTLPDGGIAPQATALYYGTTTPTFRSEVSISGVKPGGMVVMPDETVVLGAKDAGTIIYNDISPYETEEDWVDMSTGYDGDDISKLEVI